MIDLEMVPDGASTEVHLLLADFECPHGSLPEDTVVHCDCWGPRPPGAEGGHHAV